MDAHVLIPLKRLDNAKSRLSEALSPAARASLMLGLMDGVVATVRAAGVRRITLVTSDDVAHPGAETWLDGNAPWNDALARAADAIVTEEIVAVISADLPTLQPSDVSSLLERTPRRGIAIARAHDGGTNAVSLRPPGVVPTLFGAPASATLHAEAARVRGLDYVIIDLPGLAFDVDTPEDLARMMAARSGARDAA